jgi:hypothetical protein
MENKTTIIAIIAIVIALIAAIAIINIKGSAPSKYTGFAQTLKDRGFKFYGAFWCPHCAAQEKTFTMSRQSLEDIGLYHECSTPDSQGQTQICKDAHIESYPTWEYPKPIVITATTSPTLCPIRSALTDKSPAVCQNVASDKYMSWIFAQADGKDIDVQSLSQPTTKGNVWTFDNTVSRTTGDLTLQFLATQAGVTLPQ